MPANPIVLVDMDSVLVDWAPRYHQLLRTICNEVGEPYWLPDGPRTTWNTPWSTPMQHGLVQYTFAHPDLYRDLPPIPGGFDAVRAMDAAGIDVFIVTSADPENPACLKYKRKTVVDHLGTDWLDRLVTTHDKTLVRGDVLVDDKPSIHGVYAPAWRRIVFDQPWNQATPGPRLTDWNDWPTVVWNEIATAHTHR